MDKVINSHIFIYLYIAKYSSIRRVQIPSWFRVGAYRYLFPPKVTAAAPTPREMKWTADACLAV